MNAHLKARIYSATHRCHYSETRFKQGRSYMLAVNVQTIWTHKKEKRIMCLVNELELKNRDKRVSKTERSQ